MSDTSQRSVDTISGSVYQDLIGLTFLCGCGIPLEQLMERFLATVRPDVPAAGLWLFADGQLVARSCMAGLEDPPTPPTLEPSPKPRPCGADRLAVFIAPAVTLTCLPQAGRGERAVQVVMLAARIIALAWKAEQESRRNQWEDDYRQARASFERRWLTQLLGKHQHNISEAARAAGLSRVYLYEMLARYGLR